MDVTQAREEISRLQKYIVLVETYKVTSFETAVIAMYAVNQKVTAVTEELNKKGYKIGNRKITTNDVSAVLMSKPNDELHVIVQKMFKAAKKKMTNVFS